MVATTSWSKVGIPSGPSGLEAAPSSSRVVGVVEVVRDRGVSGGAGRSA